MDETTERRAFRVTVIAAIVLVAIMLVMIVAVFGARRFAADRIEGDVRDTLAQAAELAAVAEAENVDRLAASAKAVAADPDLAAALRGGATESELEPFARRLQQATDGARGAFVVAPDATLVAMYPVDRAVLGSRYSDRDWYKGVQKASPYVSEKYRMKAYDQPEASTVAVAIRDRGGVLGYATVAVEARSFGRALERTSKLEHAPALRVLDQRGALLVGEKPAVLEGDKVISARRPVRGTGWTLVASVSEEEAYRDLHSVRIAATVFLLVTFALLLVLGAVLVGTIRRLLATRRLAERRAQAFELNDTIVQRLAVSHLALSLGRREEAMESLEEALDAGRRIISDLAGGRESYVRTEAAGSAGRGASGGDAS